MAESKPEPAAKPEPQTQRTMVQALTSFTANNAQGVPTPVHKDRLYYADDFVVTSQPHLFGAPEVMTSESAAREHRPIMYPAVETAVAPPGGPVRAPVTAAGRIASGRRPGTRPPGEV